MAFMVKVPKADDPETLVEYPTGVAPLELVQSSRYFLLCTYTKGNETSLNMTAEVFNRYAGGDGEAGWYPLQYVKWTDAGGLALVDFSLSLTGSAAPGKKLRFPLCGLEGDASLFLSQSDGRLRLTFTPVGDDGTGGSIIVRIVPDSPYTGMQYPAHY